MKIIKKLIKRILVLFVTVLFKTKFGHVLYDIFTKVYSNYTITVSHNSCEMTFSAGAILPKWRAETFSTKEPETLEWIDSFKSNSIFWDVGANIGTYSIYAAKLEHGIKVFSFEPSVFNLEYLARNINLNHLSDKVSIIANPLSDISKIGLMNMSNINYGGAMSSFDTLIGFDGNEITPIFSYKINSFSSDDLVLKYKLPQPDYIKIDVDGTEELILIGSKHILKNKNLKSILIEVNDDFESQASQISHILTENGFKLFEKRHSEVIDWLPKFKNTYNQIWVRN